MDVLIYIIRLLFANTTPTITSQWWYDDVQMYTDVSHKIQDTPIYNLVCITFEQSGLQNFRL